MKIALLLVGFGNVARRFVTLLDEMRPALAGEDIEPVVVGITTRSHGTVFEAAGLDAVKAAARRAEGDAIGPVAASPSTLECLGQLDSQSIETRVLVETTTLDIQSGEPAISHVRAALARGVHVITANKGPAAFRYRELAQLADARGVSFLFEGAVMDGIPIFNLVRETAAGRDHPRISGGRQQHDQSHSHGARGRRAVRSRAGADAGRGRRRSGSRHSTSTAGTPQRRRRRWPTCCSTPAPRRA